MCGETRTHGSEGAPAQQCAGATRRNLVRRHHPPGDSPRHVQFGQGSHKRIQNYIAHWNSNAEPFVWTATADEILAKVRLVQANIKKLLDNNAK